MRIMRLALPLVLAAGQLLAGSGSDSTNGKKKYLTHHVNPHAPAIDGILTDEAWRSVDWSDSFTQREPFEGKPPSQQTAFKILYDDKNLYVAIRAFDDEPDKIERRITRRDAFDGDWVEINIDSYFDHRTAFSFTITAGGVKGDEAISNDGDNWDANWDPVWYAAVSVDNEGWVAEMRIPFSQLRFAADKEEQVWGIQVQRRLFRKQERSVWQFIPRKTPGWVSYFGELHGITAIKPVRRIEIMPYGLTGLERFQPQTGNPFATGSDSRLGIGLDAKIGVTSDLTLDATINPDFGQVEADPSEVNLTAFETFFEEKRPFFIEGQNILDFRLMGGDGSFSNDRLFYTRRIGRSPQHFPQAGDNEFVDQPDNTSIATALKLTGKTQSGLSIGVLNALTTRETADIDNNGQRRGELVEPLTNYFIGRLQQDFSQGNTAIGGMLTATNRDISESQLNFLNKAAYSGGVDFRHQWAEKTYYFEARSAFSHIEGSEEAILRAQTSSARYFQRPDAGYVSLDSTRTSLTGHGGYVTFGRSGQSALRFSAGGMWRSPNLDLNDLGFMRQADRIMQYTWLGYRITEPFVIFHNFNFNFNQWWGWNFGGETVFAGGNINGGGQLKNYGYFWFGFGREGANLSTSALRGGPAMKFPAQWTNWYSVESDSRKSLRVGLNGFNSWADDGGTRFHDFQIWMNWRPLQSVSLQINPFYSINKDDLQYITTGSFAAENRYLFGRLDQETLGITLRLNYSLTPTMSLQYYGQPFVSAGSYDAFKRVTRPRADDYSARFHQFSDSEIRFDANTDNYEIDENGDGTIDYQFSQPNFNFRQFRSNLVFRWEYSPGSTFFLVWTQDRTGSNSQGNFSFRNDLDELFSVYPHNVFLVKVSRWFSL